MESGLPTRDVGAQRDDTVSAVAHFDERGPWYRAGSQLVGLSGMSEQ